MIAEKSTTIAQSSQESDSSSSGLELEGSGDGAPPVTPRTSESGMKVEQETKGEPDGPSEPVDDPDNDVEWYYQQEEEELHGEEWDEDEEYWGEGEE